MISWVQAVDIINARDLDKLVRSSAQSLQYCQAKESYIRSHGGMAHYMIAERLGWEGDKKIASGDPFLTNERDIKILINDFSYDFEPSVRHFVVWSKMSIPCGPDEFPTREGNEAVETFLKNQFVSRANMARENIIWFKNPAALQSIPSVSHFHVLVRYSTEELSSIILGPLHNLHGSD